MLRQWMVPENVQERNNMQSENQVNGRSFLWQTFVVAAFVVMIAAFAAFMWMLFADSSGGIAADFIRQNRSAIKHQMVERAASQLDSNTTATLLRDAQLRDLNVRYCNLQSGLEFRSYYTETVHCNVYVKLEDPIRVALDAKYWLKIDKDSKSFFNPLSETLIAAHGISKYDFQVETYDIAGTTW